MDKCNSILDTIRGIKVCLYQRGQDVNETVIRELLENYNSNSNMTKVDYILNMITNNIKASNDSDSSSEECFSAEDNFDDLEDLGNLQNSDNLEDLGNLENSDDLEDSNNPDDSGNFEASDILPEESGNVEKYAASSVDSDNNTERPIQRFIHLIQLLKKRREKRSMENKSSIHDNHDDHDITDKMTESNVVKSPKIAETIDLSSDSYNDINFCQSTNDSDVIIENVIPTSSSSSLHNPFITTNNNQAECSKKNDNDVIYIKKVTKRIRMSKSPQPGCSKDFDSANMVPELEEVQDCIDCDGCDNCYTSKKLHEEARKIRSLLPASYPYHSIFGRLVCNNFAENRVELTLWDLLPVERPKVQFKQNSSSPDNLLQMNMSNFRNFSERRSADTETKILENEEKACASSKMTADVKSENGEPPINEDSLYNRMISRMTAVTNNDTQQRSVSPIKICEASPINNKDSFTNGTTAVNDIFNNDTRQTIVEPIKIREALPINNKDSFANGITAVNDIFNNDTRQTIVEPIKIREALPMNNIEGRLAKARRVLDDIFNNDTRQRIESAEKLKEAIAKANHKEKMLLMKKRKFDILDFKEDNSCNNDKDQQGTSFEKEKVSESGTSSKDINSCNMHHLEKSTLLKGASDYCDYSAPTTFKASLLREAKLLYYPNNMDAVAGPSTSSLPSFQSLVRISPPKINYVPRTCSQNANVLNMQRAPTSSMWPMGAIHNPPFPLAENKEASNMNTALPHSSVNFVQWNRASLQNRLSESKALFEPSMRVDVQNSNMFLNPSGSGLMDDPTFAASNVLHPSQFNATNNVSALNLSQNINNNEQNSNLGQDGSDVDAVQVYNEETVKQEHMLPHTSAGPSASEKQEGSNNVESKEKEIILSEAARKLYYKIIPMFPNVNTDFIKQLCQNTVDTKQGDETTLLQHLADYLLEHGSEHPYVKERPLTLTNPVITYDLNEQYADLLGIFPEADPEYLRQVAEKIYNDPEKFKYFVQSKIDNPDYPTREQYLNKKKISEQVKQYTTNFDVKQFLDIFPDPFAHFEDRTRQCVFNAYAVDFLKYSFNKIRVNTMLSFYSRLGYNLSATAKALESMSPNMKSKRCCKIMPTENIPLLQEIAFLQHKVEIQNYLNKLEAQEKEEFNMLKATNGLLECQCCYDNECMPSKCSACEDGHLFCNLCIARSTDVTLADGKTHVLCLLNCGREFSLSVLQKILPPTKFSILLCKRQEAEVMAAGVEGLVACPFCHFASIPPPEDKVFKCFNPDCMKESCRLCKELNHVPLKCDEVKTDAARLFLEEKMTEALVRKCYKCGRTFFKEEGCNKMTCVCGALMCYICDKPVKGYDHFQGQGAMGSNLCPLWSDDRRMNAEAVIKVCQETMKHIKEKNPNINLNVESLLPALPSKRKGPHEDIVNANAIPLHADRVARQIQ